MGAQGPGCGSRAGVRGAGGNPESAPPAPDNVGGRELPVTVLNAQRGPSPLLPPPLPGRQRPTLLPPVSRVLRFPPGHPSRPALGFSALCREPGEPGPFARHRSSPALTPLLKPRVRWRLGLLSGSPSSQAYRGHGPGARPWSSQRGWRLIVGAAARRRHRKGRAVGPLPGDQGAGRRQGRRFAGAV